MIQKVTPEQVRDMGKKYFAPEKQSIVVVGDSARWGALSKYIGCPPPLRRSLRS